MDRTFMVATGVPAAARTLCIFVERFGECRLFTANLSKNGDKPALSLFQIKKLIGDLKGYGPLYLTVDTYLAMVFQMKVLAQDQVAGVFPWPADTPCKVIPKITPTTDAISRNTAFFYWNLRQHRLHDWEGRDRAFIYKASNTVSFRAYAPYQNLDKNLRATIRPVNPTNVTLQFDWSAAEWNLILQHLGYDPPEDAYSTFLEAGLDRDLTKKTVLAYIYGAMRETLYTNAHGDTTSIDAILARLDLTYPKVNQWREQCINCRLAEFNGFHYDLGDAPHARPNHFAQTALQLCKWELLSRLTCAGVANLGCGDLHDQLFFDVEPLSQKDAVATVIAEVRKPLFGRYNLRPKFKPPSLAWG